jgi:hypothetical protein
LALLERALQINSFAISVSRHVGWAMVDNAVAVNDDASSHTDVSNFSSPDLDLLLMMMMMMMIMIPRIN